MLRQHLSDEALDHAMPAPALVLGEHANRSEALLLLADALKRLVASRRRQQRKALELAVVVEQVAAEHLAQVRRVAERREHEKDEAALRAFTAPRARAQRRVEAEDRIATRERSVVAIHARERARDCELRGRAQDREQLDLRSDLRHGRPEQAFRPDA